MMRQRPLIWLLALFVVTFVASTAIANVGVKQSGETTPAMMAEESSFAVSSTTPAMTSFNTQGVVMEKGQIETANTAVVVNINMACSTQMMTTKTADEDGARIGTKVRPIDGEMVQTAALVGEVTANAANMANSYPAAATTEKNPVDAAQINSNSTSFHPTNPQDAAVNFAQSEVWAPNLTAVTVITSAVVNPGATCLIGQEVVAVILYTAPINAQS